MTKISGFKRESRKVVNFLDIEINQGDILENISVSNLKELRIRLWFSGQGIENGSISPTVKSLRAKTLR